MALSTATLAALLGGCTEPEPADGDGDADAGVVAPLADGQGRIARLQTAAGVRSVPYVIVDGRPMSGDIILPDAAIDASLWAAPAPVRRWPGGVIPFEIASDVVDPQRIHDAIAHYQRQTSIRLVPRRSTDLVYLRFIPYTGSSFCGLSDIGRRYAPLNPPPGALYPQNLQLSGTCGSAGTVIHELGHALGLWHEQSRPDRDSHVIVHWENIEDDAAIRYQFEKHDLDGDVLAGPYDFDSIMHYGSKFGSANGLPTLTRLDGTEINQQRTGLSDGDLRALESMYPTSASEAPAMCRTAPPRRATRRRADVAEVWEDVGPTMSIATHTSTGMSFRLPMSWATRAGGWSVRTRWAAGDFDNDGDQDLVGVWKDAGNKNTLTLWRSNGASFTPTHWLAQQGDWLDSTEWLPGDFDGDGRTDLMSVWKDGASSTFTFWRSTGAAFAAPVHWAVRQGGWTSLAKWNVGDFNLDGRDDILSAWPEGTGTTFTVRLSTNGGLAPQHWLQAAGGWASNMQFLVGNFDGAGGADVMVAWDDGGASTLTFYRNQGTSLAAGTNWATRDGGWANNVRWSAGDYNADGRDDVLAIWNEAGRSTLTVRRSTGLTSPRLITEHWGTRRAGWQDSASWCTGTFDVQ